MNSFHSSYTQELCRDEVSFFSNKDYLVKKELSWEVVDNGVVIPPLNISRIDNRTKNPEGTLIGAGGVVDRKGRYIKLSSQPAYGVHNRVSGMYKIDNEDIVESDETVMYMNFYIHQWGHYLIDVINRLWYAINIDKSIKIVYTCYRGKHDRIDGNYLELLRLLGIDEKRLIMINQPTRFKKVIIPEWSLYPGKYYTLEYVNMIEKIVEKVPHSSTGIKKVYCSRSKLNSNKEKGEDVIERILNKNGFVSVHMEALSLVEQIQLLNSVESIAMFSGSLAHNLLFIRKNCQAFIINKTYRLNIHQFIINQISEASAIFIDAYCSPLKVLYGYGPFLIKTTPEFLRFCDEYGIKYDKNDNNDMISKKELLLYYCRWIWIYKKFLIVNKPIIETQNAKLEKSGKEVRKYFKAKYGCGI